MFSVLAPSPSVLDAILGEQRGQEFSYPDVGATRGPLPQGYRHARHVVELGNGERRFLRAVEGLRQWEAHVRSGVVIRPPRPPLEDDLTVVFSVPLARVYVTVACRIVYVIEETARFGFAYGTLPHHVIEGEELFLVERDDEGRVRFLVSAFVRPRGRLMRAVAPVVQLLDERLVRRYLRGLQRHVAAAA